MLKKENHSPHSPTVPYWISSIPQLKEYSALKGKLHVDVTIIGAGITGLSAALQLKLAGKRVAVVEQHQVGSGETGHTTAHLTEMMDAGYSTLQRDYGKESARQIAQAMQAANDQIARWVREFQIDCDFERVPGYLYVGGSEDTNRTQEISQLKSELKACQESGVIAHWVDHVPLPFQTQGGVRVEDQAQIHPLKYLKALAERIPGEGSFLFEKTPALKMEEGDPCRVFTPEGELFSDYLIIATHSPSHSRFLLPTKVAAYRTYALSARLRQEPTERALFWDTADPYHYIRSEKEFWIIGGEDHKTGMKRDTEESFKALRGYVQSHFGIKKTLSRWSGQILESIDGLPFIGASPSTQKSYVATGYSGNGVTFGSLSGILLSDLILKRANKWADLFKPSRVKPFVSIKAFVSENKDFPLCMMKDYILRTNISGHDAIKSLKPGEGCVVSQKGLPVAVSRNLEDKLHSVSAVCPHMGCQVHWNTAEKSWDCPCHGSRFSSEGELLTGPALTGLKLVELAGVIPAVGIPPAKKKRTA